MKQFEYNGYIGSIEFDLSENFLFGKLLFIRDLVTYEADDPKGLELAFHEAVDDYLADCAEDGCEPNKPFKGAFNVRVKPELHKALAIAAKSQGLSLNEYVAKTLSAHDEVGVAIEQFSRSAQELTHKLEYKTSQYFSVVETVPTSSEKEMSARPTRHSHDGKVMFLNPLESRRVN